VVPRPLAHHGRHRASRGPGRLLAAYGAAAIAAATLLATVDLTGTDPRWVAGQAPAAAIASAAPAAALPAPRTVALQTGPVYVDSAGFLSWALLDRRTGQISGSANLSAPSDTMSMVKAWIAADYLRLAAERDVTPTPARMRQLTIMIRDSDNAAAQSVFGRVGRRASIERLVEICGLTETGPYQNWWSNTTVSARDTVRMGACLADGRAAGPRWTPWLLAEMRHVRGTGDFGVRTALPARLAATVAIKNGWLLRDEDRLWHISCLAIGADWVLSVLLRYPGRLGFEYGTRLCREVGKQLISPV
jgi:hypothetical protein